MRYKSQKTKVLERLLTVGWINEAYAQKRGINRLPALIYRLKAQGYHILSIRDGDSTTYIIGKP